ncbi:F-box LRR-repeat 15 [Chlorella sorokiniana]|uniref:F-box LRR-repeat 15 n=1 Tax=Chlorella sorokiniana TaxID=3076 RepID=A0A2P6TXU0_CHLSO|nr:F-box LRR-repeat 15 [Chlorella sorokiniana]|eukprot:PRW58889.1 F-box LRR-repeat 15 [Chlorella sorokiniana]
MSGRAGAPSRSQQAFRWLLQGDDDDERRGNGSKGKQAGDKGSSGKGGGRRRSGSGSGSKPPFIPGFKLRCEAEAEAAAAGSSAAVAGSDLESLQQAFAGVLDAELVADVLASTGGDAAAAMEALLSLTGGGEDVASPGAAGEADAPASQAAVSGTSSAVMAEAAGSSAPAASCYWDTLPQEMKQLVFEQLSLRDLARAARACREFAGYVREQRRSLRTVTVPEGVSYAAVRGLVAAFAGAEGVALSRCAAQLRFPHEYEAMLRAVQLGEQDRQGGVPIRSMSLARCDRISDAAVGELCDTFTSLQRVDLTRCVEVGDTGMTRLAAYTRQLGGSISAGSGSSDEEEEEDWQADAAAEAVGGMQLAADAPSPPAVGTTGGRAFESPDSAVRRIAAQRHAAMLARSAREARSQHGRPRDLGLRELVLKETSVSARGTKLLLQPGSTTSKSLRVLDVSRCPNIAGDALDLHPRCVLESLRAAGCNGLRSVVIQLPAEAPLRSLNLESCRQLHEVVLVARQLESASFSHCGQLRTVSLRCRCLRELKAVNCGSLSLAASELHCPALQEANFFGCRQLDAEGLEAAAPSLTKCTSLDLTGCTGLSRLLLPDSTALRSISVAGCGVLRQVLLASPALTQLRAAGCSRLMELRLGTAALCHLDLENCGHLREVQLSEGPSRASLDAGSRAAEAGGERRRKPALVLRGCTSLPDQTKQRLREAVLGS